MTGKFLIGENSSLHVEDISKTALLCSFHSLLNYRVIGDINNPDALDPSGGPFIALGYEINDGTLKRMWLDPEQKQYLMLFERKLKG